MTLIVGLRCINAVVLASDSQGTYGGLKRPTPKLFKTRFGLVWGTAGPLSASQTLYTELDKLGLDPNPCREDAKAGIRQAVLATARELDESGSKSEESAFEGLFAWYDRGDHRNYLLRVRSNGDAEFMTQYGAVGSSKQIAEFGFFGFNRSEYLDYKTLPLETAKMLAHMVADDAVRASAQGVDGPIQLAVVTASESTVLRERELQPVRDTAAAFQMHQLDFLVREEGAKKTGPGTGLIPGKRTASKPEDEA